MANATLSLNQYHNSTGSRRSQSSLRYSEHVNLLKRVATGLLNLLRGDLRDWNDIRALLVRMLLYLVGTGVFLLIQVVQFVGFVYLGFERVYAPLAAAPGARDGAGLLIVASGVLLGAAVGAAVLSFIEVKLVQVAFPDWSPPDTDV